MDTTINSKVNVYRLLLAAVSVCYLVFPNHNQTLDAWEYAQNVKYATELFRPHHLLYNGLMYGLKSFPLFSAVDTIVFMQFVNGVFALASLGFLYRILWLLYQNQEKALLWTLLGGSTFAMLRYGTENETYIIPLFFSTVASYYFSQYIQQKTSIKYLIISGLFSAISCLFHQIHVFWWLSLMAGVCWASAPKRTLRIMAFALPALLVPVVYALVLVFSENKEITINNFLSFVFDYYYSENADIKINNLNFILTPISFFRSFFQIHGNILHLLRAQPVAFAALAVFWLFMVYRVLFPFNSKVSLNFKNIFINVHFGAFALQFAFAFYSKGNSEFMVMLPFLLLICLSYWLSVDSAKLLYLAGVMFSWNMAFAILPNHWYNFENNEKIIQTIHENKRTEFILDNKHKAIVQYYYVYGEDISGRVFSAEEAAASQLADTFYTDILAKPKLYNRAAMVLSNSNNLNYTFIRNITKVKSFYGDYTIDQIVLNHK